jgi:hypothetical protein
LVIFTNNVKMQVFSSSSQLFDLAKGVEFAIWGWSGWQAVNFSKLLCTIHGHDVHMNQDMQTSLFVSFPCSCPFKKYTQV